MHNRALHTNINICTESRSTDCVHPLAMDLRHPLV